MYFSTVTPALLAFAGFVAAHPSGAPSHPTGHPHPPPGHDDCKCFPGDDCWPTSCEWGGLNATVDGRLIATVPLATPCHGDAYDADECATLQDEWLYSTVHFESASSVMAPLFTNQSCDPFTSKDVPCTLGNYVSYSVNASCPEDIVAALEFADKHNLRFVIRNTGHDYNGKSTGAGALAVWTHNLKDTEVMDWSDKYYTGKALKVGAGVQGFEALEAAHASGLAIVTGECPSVGLAGGYTQGGGHSALATKFGLAADNTLSFEVVTPEGKLVTASREQNSDLYWALSGGGGGVYGVVYSLTVRAHPDDKIGGAKFAVSPPADDPDKLYDIIDAFHAALPDIVDAGVMIIYFFGEGFLQVPAMTAYGKTKAEAEAILKPFSDSLDNMGLSLNANFTGFSSYHDHYDHYWGPLPAGNIQVGTTLFGGRLIPRKVLPDFHATAKKIVELGVTFIGVGLDVSSHGKNGQNAVLPQWRDSIVQSSLTFPYSFEVPFVDMLEVQNNMTKLVQPVIEAATPGAGAYMNEADFQQADFQDTFYGTNYHKLSQIKHKYDPKGMLYAITGVGSEHWEQRYDGRLCKVKPGHPGHDNL